VVSHIKALRCEKAAKKTKFHNKVSAINLMSNARNHFFILLKLI
jgi:hypothetical protein